MSQMSQMGQMASLLNEQVLLHPFALGFYLGCIFLLISLYQYLKLKSELSRFRRHLSDRLEIEADTMRKSRQEVETLRKENESLRIKVSALNDTPDRKASRDLEVYARAEKRMFVNVPGFAPAWETAKSEAGAELAEEEAGRSTPKRIFTRLFGGSEKVALPGRESDAKNTASDSV
jgi:hypothetical protein